MSIRPIPVLVGNTDDLVVKNVLDRLRFAQFCAWKTGRARP
jgi:hypothetical protein